VRKRRPRRILAAVAALVYLGAIAWLISPLWHSASAVTPGRVVRKVPFDPSLGVAPLSASKALPNSLPGSSEGSVTALETSGSEVASGSEVVGESGSETVAEVPESSETQASPSPSTESSQSSAGKTIIGGEG
jgi:hypothetical protein